MCAIAWKMLGRVRSKLGSKTKVEALVAKFKVAMDDDFNTQNGITVVYELARELNVYAAREEVNRATLNIFYKILQL